MMIAVDGPSAAGKGTLARMIAAYERLRRDGRLPATYEVVFGQAWAPAARPRPQAVPGEVTVPIGQIGRSGSRRS